ncbi:MAG: response regulator [Lachnospiraceae bacterium]|jgi:signal transduction histidine kinase/FixJ family two-component response regulator/HPt (histidine-containing phosphotransfer) domain-containing protein|nr:response regulator [Lachnospiraceae bacterium]
MYILKAVFIILFLISMGCVVKGIADKRRNIGYIILTLMIATGNLFSIGVLDLNQIRYSSNIFLPYYIMHAWSFFAFLLMVILIEQKKRHIVSVVMTTLICIYQTYLIASQYFGARILSFQKRIYFRKAFWVVVDSKNTGLFFSYRSYRIALYVNIFIILCVLLTSVIRSHKIFRTRYYTFIIMAIVYSVVEALKVQYTIPIWIPCMTYNIVSILCLYLTNDYARNILREWSLDRFANDMSDGLILYDKHDDLIHMNNMIKNTLSDRLVDRFKDKNKLDEWLDEWTDGNNDRIVKYHGRDKDFYLTVNVRKFGEEDSPIGTLYILHDATDSVTQLKVMEEANDSLEKANRMKSDFLANMSHEIRTPMNAVIGLAEIAMREKNPDRMADYLLQIQSSGRSLLNIINDILDYSKIESGKMEIIEEDYEPLAEYSDIASVIFTRIGDKPIELFVAVETNLPHILRGDAMRIRQVLTNLAGNAVKFTKEGIVRIHIDCQTISEDTVNMTYHVVDTGIGIRKEDLDKLFLSFQQVDSKRNRSVEGTGLGLAISQRLVESMGGTIGVKSEYGRGSDFWFTIPQKVVDSTNDIVVDNASDKHAFVFDDDGLMLTEFCKETDRLGVTSTIVDKLSDYAPTGKKDFFFFKEERYTDDIKTFLEEHPDVNGIVLVGITSDFKPEVPNLHLMRRPESSMNMVGILNERYDEVRKVDTSKIFKPDFTAPDAKILIVDDNHINLTIAGDLIEPIKANIETADGGKEAIEKMMANKYDIVFMDHMMPEIDGVDVTKTIRAAGDEVHQPVIIALSANVMGDAKKLFAEAGMDDFVAKPINVRILIAKIKQWLPQDKIVEKDGNEEDEDDGSDSLIRCEGLDAEAAVHALGSESLYNKIVGEYYRSGEDKYNGIEAAFTNEDWETYTINVHALKSSSRQIGAMELGSLAEALEKAGKAGDTDTIKADTAAALAAYKELLGKLSEHFDIDDEDDADKQPIDKDTLLALLGELEDACDNLDMDSMEDVDARLKAYSYDEETKQDMDTLSKAIADIDTDECMGVIGRLRERFE